jgi:hypothetical protein
MGNNFMSIECGICERDARAGHADDCPRNTEIVVAANVKIGVVELLDALEKSCRKEVSDLSFLSKIKSDLAASRYGALVPSISSLTGLPGASVRARLRKLVADGLVIEYKPSYKGGMSNYWPVGLLQKISASTTKE